jgi:hypothetical protein
MFSVQLHIPFDSKLGQRLALLQHVVALSVVSAICSLPGGYDVCTSVIFYGYFIGKILFQFL